MKVWVLQRRKAGVVVPPKFTLGVDGRERPLELLVKNVTDQGLRRLGKVARLYALGDPMVAELLQPKLVWMRETAFVISGTEKQANGHRQNVGFAQSWLCHLASPLSGFTLRMLETIKEGIPVPGPQLRDRVFRGWPGTVHVSSEFVPLLGRHAKVGRFNPGGSSTPSVLLDVELEWMTEDRYELSGTSVLPALGGRFETHFAGGWLCRYWAPDPEEPSRGKVSTHWEEWKG